ncbi:hypothetical protein AAFN87_17215 [Solibacillus sp. CAU 1738]
MEFFISAAIILGGTLATQITSEDITVIEVAMTVILNLFLPALLY